MKSLFIAAFTVAILATLAPASAAQGTASNGLKASTGTSRVAPVQCKGVARCNSIISYCAEKNGVWKETSHNTQGQPTAGRCTLS